MQEAAQAHLYEQPMFATEKQCSREHMQIKRGEDES